MEQVTTCLCVSMCVRESHSESEREGVEGVSLSSQAQGHPCQGVAQRRGRVCLSRPTGRDWLTVSGCC